MNRYNRILANRKMRYLHEDEDEEIIIEEPSIQDELYDIVNNLGYTFTMNNGSTHDGTISISDNLSIYIRFINDSITKIYIITDINNDRIDCTRNTSTADNISVDIQTCVLIIKEIRQKLMWGVGKWNLCLRMQK